ncbi:MAG TPA: hypothetical protein VH496_12380 [Mycobacterium sp.]
MDLFDVVRSCVRRWYVFVPLLLIAGWFSYSSYTSAQPVYYSSAVIGIAPPSTEINNPLPGVPQPRNGLLDVGGASLIANMAAVGLREPSVVDRVVAAGGLPTYTSKLFPVPATSPELPLIMVEVTDADPAAVSKTLRLVVAQAAVTLRSLQQQAQVPDEEMVAPFVVSPPGTPVAGMPSRTRSTISTFVAGAGLAVLLSVLVDVFLTRRKAKRRPATAKADEETKLVSPPGDAEESISAVATTEGAVEAR